MKYCHIKLFKDFTRTSFTLRTLWLLLNVMIEMCYPIGVLYRSSYFNNNYSIPFHLLSTNAIPNLNKGPSNVIQFFLVTIWLIHYRSTKKLATLLYTIISLLSVVFSVSIPIICPRDFEVRVHHPHRIGAYNCEYRRHFQSLRTSGSHRKSIRVIVFS